MEKNMIIDGNDAHASKVLRAMDNQPSGFWAIVEHLDTLRELRESQKNTEDSLGKLFEEMAAPFAKAMYGIEVGDFIEVTKGERKGVYKVEEFNMRARYKLGGVLQVRVNGNCRLVRKDKKLGQAYWLDFDWQVPVKVDPPEIRNKK